MNLETWLTSLDEWINHPLPSSKSHRTKLQGVDGIVKIAYSRKSDVITSAYLVNYSDFDIIMHGNKIVSGILTIQCGFVCNPFQSVFIKPEDMNSIKKLKSTVLRESTDFFSEVGSLENIYRELTSENPQFRFADPRGPSVRLMHSAIVAYLLDLDWRHHMNAALETKFPLSNDWLVEVRGRLERAAAEKSKSH